MLKAGGHKRFWGSFNAVSLRTDSSREGQFCNAPLRRDGNLADSSINIHVMYLNTQ